MGNHPVTACTVTLPTLAYYDCNHLNYFKLYKKMFLVNIYDHLLTLHC